jgi:hypothetical protein
MESIFNSITQQKSAVIRRKVQPNLYDPLLADIFCREINQKINIMYLYQRTISFDWLNLLVSSPETFVIMFSKFEPRSKRINAQGDLSHNIVFFMCFLYAKHSQLFYNNPVFLNEFVNNMNTPQGRTNFQTAMGQVKNDIKLYTDKLTVMLNNIKNLCITMKKMSDIEFNIIKSLFETTFTNIIPLHTVLDSIETYNMLKNSIDDIHNLCGSFSENINLIEGLNVFRTGWYTEDFYRVSDNYMENDRSNMYRNFSVINDRSDVGPLLLTSDNNVYNFSGVNSNWDKLSSILKTPEKLLNIYEWYDWASQFWLKSSYKLWFKTFKLLIRSISEEVIMIYRTTDLLLIDETTPGVYLFVHNLLTELNMPSLQSTMIIRLNNVWFLPPEKFLNIRTISDYVELHNDDNQNNFNTLNEKNNFIIQKLLNRTAIGLNTMIYTSDMALISRLTINEIDVYVTSYHMEPFNIIKFRQHILENRTICGPLTSQVFENTRLYTYLFLLFLSRGSGLPIYSGFGLGNMFSIWNMMIKTYNDSIIRDKPNETSLWLARNNVGNVELNGILITEIIIRLLGKTFKFEKIKRNKEKQGAYSIYLKKAYDKMKEENIFGTKRCHPVIVDETWSTMWNYDVQSERIWNDIVEDGVISNEKYNPEPFTGDDNRFEWCTGQRMIFEKHFYYPKNIEDVLNDIKLRFKNWCPSDVNVLVSLVN